MTYKSIAVWPRPKDGGPSLFDPNNESCDTHGSQEQAEAVCRILQSRGLGGDGQIFPISTRVEEIS